MFFTHSSPLNQKKLFTYPSSSDMLRVSFIILHFVVFLCASGCATSIHSYHRHQARQNKIISSKENKLSSNFSDAIESRELGNSSPSTSLQSSSMISPCPLSNFANKTIAYAFPADFDNGNSSHLVNTSKCCRIQLFDGGTFSCSMDGHDSNCNSPQLNSRKVFSKYQPPITSAESLLLGPTSVSNIAYFYAGPDTGETLGWKGEFKFHQQTSGSSSNELKVEVKEWNYDDKDFLIYFTLPSCDADQPFILSVDTPMPSHQASFIPSALPSPSPLTAPSAIPSILTSEIPSTTPTLVPSVGHSNVPSAFPSVVKSSLPSGVPSLEFSAAPSQFPTVLSSSTPSVSLIPSLMPTVTRSERPSLSGCKDRKGKFMVTQPNRNVIIRSCKWVSGDSTARRCSFSGVARQCRKTCGVCTETPTTIPSAAPSWKPTPTRAPVEVEATILLRLGPISAKPMTAANQKLLEDTINASLNEQFVSTTPKIEIVKTTITNQVVEKMSREHSSTRGRKLLVESSKSYFVFFDLIVKGNFEPIGAAGDENSFTTAGDVQFHEQLETFFSSYTTSVRLVDTLKNYEHPDAKYFKFTEEILFTATKSTVNLATDENGDDNRRQSFFRRHMAIIIASVVSTCAVIILLVGVYVYKMRRYVCCCSRRF